MINNSQRRFLASMATNIKASHQIGKEGITDQVVDSLLNYLRVHELMKVSILKNSTSEVEEIKDYLAEFNIEVVRIIGRQMILYKENKKLKDSIVLPK